MGNVKDGLAFLGVGVTIGVILTIILVFIIGAKPSGISVGGVDFNWPTATITIANTPTDTSLAPPQQLPEATNPSTPTPVIITHLTQPIERD